MTTIAYIGVFIGFCLIAGSIFLAAWHRSLSGFRSAHRMALAGIALLIVVGVGVIA